MTVPIAKINSVLESWAATFPPIMDFTVENVLSAISYESTYEFVFRFLNSKDGFEILISKIYLCPENHKAYHGPVDEELDDYDLPTCHICAHAIINDTDHSFFVFNFTRAFIEDVKKKLLQKRELLNSR